MLFCRIELLTFAAIYCSPELIDSILSAKLLLQAQVSWCNCTWQHYTCSYCYY